MHSLYWENWRNCRAPRGSPPLPQAGWAWRGAVRGESGCGGIWKVPQQRRGRHTTPGSYCHFVQEEIPVVKTLPLRGAARPQGTWCKTHIFIMQSRSMCMRQANVHLTSILAADLGKWITHEGWYSDENALWLTTAKKRPTRTKQSHYKQIFILHCLPTQVLAIFFHQTGSNSSETKPLSSNCHCNFPMIQVFGFLIL